MAGHCQMCTLNSPGRNAGMVGVGIHRDGLMIRALHPAAEQAGYMRPRNHPIPILSAARTHPHPAACQPTPSSSHCGTCRAALIVLINAAAHGSPSRIPPVWSDHGHEVIAPSEDPGALPLVYERDKLLERGSDTGCQQSAQLPRSSTRRIPRHTRSFRWRRGPPRRSSS